MVVIGSSLPVAEAAGGLLLDLDRPVQRLGEQRGDLGPALLVEDEGGAADVRVGAGVDRAGDQRRGGVLADRLEDEPEMPLRAEAGILAQSVALKKARSVAR